MTHPCHGLAGALLAAGLAVSSAAAPPTVPVAAGFAMDGLFDASGELWKTPPEAFMAGHARQGFAWTSATDHSEAKAYRQALTFLGMPVCEATARFADDRLGELTLYLYNRAEGGDRTRKAFEEMASRAQTSLSAWARSQPQPLVEERRTSGARLMARTWSWGPHSIRLEWSFTRGRSAQEPDYRAEFIRVQVTPAGTADRRSLSDLQSGPLGSISEAWLASHIRRSKNGDVYVAGLPMVSQGERGYCMVAAAERVTRYYGMDVDQHEFAQLARSSAGEGTDPRAMKTALMNAGTKLGCRIRTHLEFDFQDFDRLIEDYNRTARRQKQPELTIDRQRPDVNRLYAAMQPAIMKEVRLKRAADYRNFQSDVAEQTGKGIPLVWSVVVGLMPESPPVRGSGGHARLIIGYNDRSAEVLYSDTWGPGHEFKRMAMADAWAISVGLFTIEPRRTTK